MFAQISLDFDHLNGTKRLLSHFRAYFHVVLQGKLSFISYLSFKSTNLILCTLSKLFTVFIRVFDG